MSHFKGHFEGAKTFLTLNCPERSSGQFRGKKGSQFLKQLDINS
jgi:hypothetical protein